MRPPVYGRPISGTTRLVGLIGWPVAHTLSPAMHNAAAADLGLDLAYVPLPVRAGRLADAIAGLPALGFIGANVTVPYKESVIRLLDEVDRAAQVIGAVNTIVIKEVTTEGGHSTRFSRPHGQEGEGIHNRARRSMGYNTDWSGFMEDLAHLGVGVRDRDCWVLGAGGSARAVVYGLITGGGRPVVFARRVDQAQKLASELKMTAENIQISTRPWSDLGANERGFSSPLIINTTPVGMDPDEGLTPWPEERPFPANSFVYDLVYNPKETAFVRQAKSAGLGAAGGLGMLLRQGAKAFELWTGQRPDLGVMNEAMEQTNA